MSRLLQALALMAGVACRNPAPPTEGPGVVHILSGSDDTASEDGGTVPDVCDEDPPDTGVDWGDCTFEEVRAGAGYTCALTRTGETACWQDGVLLNGVLPGTFTTLSNHFMNDLCAVRDDGCLRCERVEGLDDVGLEFLEAVPSGLFVSLDQTGVWGCALDQLGELSCWAANYYPDDWGMLDPPSGPFVQVATASTAACALRADGTLACWGFQGSDYYFGGYMVSPDHIVEEMPTEGSFVQLDAGSDTMCALGDDGNATCWGMRDLTTPYAFEGGVGTLDGPFTEISLGTHTADRNVCGITLDGDLECAYAYGDGVTTAEGPFLDVSSGWYHSCALDNDGHMTCWLHDSERYDVSMTVPCE